MTITLRLESEAEALLRELAAREERAPEIVAADVLTAALEQARDAVDAVAGVRRGLNDFEAGRFRPFEEFAREQRQRYDLPADS